MTQLFPESAADGEMRFANAPRASLILGVLGAGAAIAFWMLMPESPVRIMFTGAFGLGALRFLAGAMRRYELLIEIEPRGWRRRSGFFFAPRTETGSLDDLTGVVLDKRHVDSGSGSTRRSVPIWSVALEFTGPGWDDTPLVIGLIDNDEPRAYRLLEHYARKLRVNAVDRTATPETRRAWDALDASGHEAERRTAAPAGSAETRGQLGTGAAVEPEATPSTSDFPASLPPDKYGVDVDVVEGRPRIVLPRYGFRSASMLGIVMGAAMCLAGTVFAIGGFGLGPFTDGAIQPVTIGVGAVFVITGISAVRAAFSRAGSREWVIEFPDVLRFGTTRGGKVIAYTEVPKQAIEEIAIRVPEDGGRRLMIMGVNVRADPAKAALIRVRTNDQVVRLGRGLAAPVRQWLRDTIASAAGVPAE